MNDKDEPERKDVHITLDVPGAIARAIDPKVSIENRVDQLAQVMQLLAQHDEESRKMLEEAKEEREKDRTEAEDDRKENRRWRWKNLAVGLIALGAAIIGIFIVYH